MKKIVFFISAGVIFYSCSVFKKFSVQESKNTDSIYRKSYDSSSSKLNSESNYRLDGTEDSSSTKKKVTDDFTINFDDIDTSTGRKYFYKIGSEEIESPKKIKSLLIHKQSESDSDNFKRSFNDTGSTKVSYVAVIVSRKDSASKHDVSTKTTESKVRFSFEWWLLIIAGLVTVCYFFYREEKTIL